MDIAKFKSQYDNFNKVDPKPLFEDFNQNYALEELKKLSKSDLVARLFGNAETKPRGLFSWIEHSKKPIGARCNGGSGGQVGVLYMGDTGESQMYTYRSGVRTPTIVNLGTEVEQYAQEVLEALEKSCNIIENSALDTEADYGNVYDDICNELKNISRPTNEYWYWNVDGAPGYFFLKYYVCSFPEKFAFTYSKDTLESVLERLNIANTSSIPFIMNGQLSLFICGINADPVNFERFITAKGFYSDFKDYCVTHDVPSGASTYKNGIKKIESNLSVNAFEEYHKDGCVQLMSRVKAVNNKDWPSYLKKFIEFCDSMFSSDTIDFLPTELYKKYAEKLKKEKNIILRGAPGTGKSFLAKKIAAYLISGDAETEYDKLDSDLAKQTEFVQFHPSYDYSDFVEGLRPVNGDDGISFELKDGIFKDFVERAKENFENSKRLPTKAKSLASSAAKIEEFLKTITFDGDVFTLPMGNTFTIADDDGKNIYVRVPANKKELLKIKKDLICELLEADTTFNTIRDIKNFFNKKNRRQEYSYAFVLYNAIVSYAENVAAGNFDVEVEPEKLKDYVFIIDEINRGEISKIFGELFYSIEPSKRGTAGAISTQYSNLHDTDEKFYIPENVYIIGTMNDIDRSVESFDFAMRRRFKFLEITAEESTTMLDGNPVQDEIIARMERLNEAIEKEAGLNRNYHVGAAYFLNVTTEEDLDELWEESLAPLLWDYIVGMYNDGDILKALEKAYFADKAEESDATEGTDDEGDDT